MLGADHDRVGRFDDYKILNTQRSHETTLATDITAAGVLHYHIPLCDIAAIITLTQLPQRRPSTHITPSAVESGYTTVLGFLHDGVVDAVRGRSEKRRLGRADKIQILLGRRHGCLACGQYIGLIQRQLFEIPIGSKQEHATVPIISAGGNIKFRRRPIGFLDKLRKVKESIREHLSRSHIAITCLRSGGHNSEGHQKALLGWASGVLNGIAKALGFNDMMICRQYQ